MHARRRFGRIPPRTVAWQRLSCRLAPMDVAHLAEAGQIPLGLRRPIGRVAFGRPSVSSSDIGGGIVRRDQPLAPPCPIMGGCIHSLAAPDHAMPAIDGDMRPVPEVRHRDVDLRLAVRAGPGFAELHRPARLGVLLARWPAVRPSAEPRSPGQFCAAFSPALMRASYSFAVRWRGADTRVASTISPAMGR
jgi:hypothetical protein